MNLLKTENGILENMGETSFCFSSRLSIHCRNNTHAIRVSFLTIIPENTADRYFCTLKAVPWTVSPLRLRILVGKNKQIVEVQVPSGDNGQSPRSLEPHVLHSSKENTLASRDTLDRVQVHELNARETIAMQQPANTRHRVIMEMITGLQVCNARPHPS